jgi:uncharacterized membrane protein YbhN (UPF0104 family)
MMPAAERYRRRLGQALQGLVLGLVVLVLARRLAGSNLHEAIALIGHMGPKTALVIVPFALAMALDTLAQRSLLAALGQRIQLGTLYLVRLSAEAASMSLPAGAVLAETVTPLLLKQRANVPYAASIVANGAKRWLTIRAQAAYIVLSVALGISTLVKVSPALTGGTALPWMTLGVALVPLGASLIIGGALLGKQWSSKADRLFPSFRRHRVVVWLDALREATGTQWVATLLLFGGWLLESVETLVILRLLGAPVGFAEVIAFEAGLALVRSLAFFAPAGVGVQDLGYLAFLGALGLPGAAALGAAFVVVKRAKEAFYIVCGGGLYFALRRVDQSTPLTTEVLP